jgi:hypothetical protein
MQLTQAQRARWENWPSLSDEERAQARAELAVMRGEEWEADEERAKPLAEADVGAPPEDEWANLSQVLDYMHAELRSIRFRLGVLVFFLVILPFVLGLIVGLIVGLTN